MIDFFRLLRVVVLESWRLLARESPHPEGWVTPAVRAVLWALSLPSTVIIDMAGFPYRYGSRQSSSRAGAMITDSFVVLCALTGIALYLWIQAQPALGLFAAIFAGWRITDICAVLLRMVLFQRASGWKHHTGYAAARERTVVLSITNYLEVIVCFGILYSILSTDLHSAGGQLDAWAPLYFSGTTQLTIGYGDIRPYGLVRLLSITQALVGLLMIAVFVTRFVGSLDVPPTRRLGLSPDQEDQPGSGVSQPAADDPIEAASASASAGEPPTLRK